MTTALFELAPSLQRLIDSRLDNIDRALMGSDLSRYERRQIVSSVEDQIHEMIDRLGKEEPSREDILRILGSLDPPEAYGNGDAVPSYVLERGIERKSPIAASPATPPRVSPLAIISLVLAGLAFVSSPLVMFLGILIMPLTFLLALGGQICGVVSLSQISSSHGTRTGAWMSIIAISMFPFIATGMLGLFLMEY